MYGGETEKVTLVFAARMIDYIYEKFGIDTKIRPCGDEGFTANVEVQLSPTFWGWLFQFTGQMRIAAPEIAVQQYKEMIETAMKDADTPTLDLGELRDELSGIKGVGEKRLDEIMTVIEKHLGV